MNKITYQNKVDIKISTLPEINKTTASTHNEVKTIVNETVDQVELNIVAVALNTAKVGISTTQASDIIVNSAKISFDTTSSTRLSVTSGNNTGDQDLSSFRLISDSYTKAEVDTLNALKANLNGNTLEIFKSANGVVGDDVVNKGQLDTKQDTLTLDDSFYFDTEGVLRPNLSTYRQSINYVSGTQVFTLSFEPTFFTGIFINGQYLDESDYIYTSPNQLEILGTLESGDRIKIIYEKFVNQP